MAKPEADFKMTLKGDEALVLLEMLARSIDGNEPLRIRNAAEYYVLMSIQCDLEKHLIAPFASNYEELVIEARQRVQGTLDDPTLVERYPDNRFNDSIAR
jgi:hypothetical protein